MPIDGDGRNCRERMSVYMRWTNVVMPDTWRWEEEFKSTTAPRPNNTAAGSKRSCDAPSKKNGKRRKLDQNSKPTRLRVNKQVKAQIPSDIWSQILIHAHPLTLFNAKLINKGFRALLQYEGIWRNCRKNYYDADIPDPPAGLTEAQYLDLLEGKGCMSCKNPAARRTYWAFLRRWCGVCFKEKTIRHESAKFVTGGGWLLDAIPCATIDSWGSYEGPSRDATKQRRPGSTRSHVYLRGDVTRIVNEYEERFSEKLQGISVQLNDCTDADKTDWRDKKKAEVDMRTEQLVRIEDWDIKRARLNGMLRQWAKERRIAYFRAKAAAMDPPLSDSALRLIPAYQRAIKIAKPPSAKAWIELLPKLEKDREVAEERDEADKMARTAALRHEECMSLIQYRTAFANEAETFLSRVADKALQSLEKFRPDLDGQDFVLMALKFVWRLYHVIPPHRRPKVPAEHEWFHTDRVFRLSLFDAIQVLELKILPALEQRCSVAGSKDARLFKCPGCTRTDVRKSWSCRLLFAHIQDRHAEELNGFQLFHTPAFPSQAWHAIEWPPNLPMLADHHQATGRWNPNDTSGYKEARRSTIANKAEVSAFSGRFPAAVVQVQDWTRLTHTLHGFINDFTLASTLLRPTKLPQDFQSLISLRYALDLYARHCFGPRTPLYPTPAPSPPRYPLLLSHHITPAPVTLTPPTPPFGVLDELVLTLIRAGDYKSLSSLRCKACILDNTQRYTRPHPMGKTGHPLGELVAHYATVHYHKLDRWTEEMFKLPSGEELAGVLKQSGMEDAKEVFERLFPVASDVGSALWERKDENGDAEEHNVGFCQRCLVGGYSSHGVEEHT